MTSLCEKERDNIIRIITGEGTKIEQNANQFQEELMDQITKMETIQASLPKIAQMVPDTGTSNPDQYSLNNNQQPVLDDDIKEHKETHFSHAKNDTYPAMKDNTTHIRTI